MFSIREICVAIEITAVLAMIPFNLDCKAQYANFKCKCLWKFKVTEIDAWVKSGGAAE